MQGWQEQPRLTGLHLCSWVNSQQERSWWQTPSFSWQPVGRLWQGTNGFPLSEDSEVSKTDFFSPLPLFSGLSPHSLFHTCFGFVASIRPGVSLLSTQAAHSKAHARGAGETHFAPVLSVDIVVCFALGGFCSSPRVVGPHLKCTRSSLPPGFTWNFSSLNKGWV